MSSAYHHIAEDLWVHLKSFSETCYHEPSVQDDKKEIFHAFHENERVIEEESPRISRKISALLEDCTKTPDINLTELYKLSLPDPYHFRKLKLELPLFYELSKNHETVTGQETNEININRVIEGIKNLWEEQAFASGEDLIEEGKIWVTLIQKERLRLVQHLENEKIRVSKEAMVKLQEMVKPPVFKRPDFERAFEESFSCPRKPWHIPAFETLSPADFMDNPSCPNDEELVKRNGPNMFFDQLQQTEQKCGECLNTSHVTMKDGAPRVVDRGEISTQPLLEKSDTFMPMKMTVKTNKNEEDDKKKADQEPDRNTGLKIERPKQETKRNVNELHPTTCKRRKTIYSPKTYQSLPLGNFNHNRHEDLSISDLNGLSASQTSRTAANADFDTSFNSSSHTMSDKGIGFTSKCWSPNEVDEKSITDAELMSSKHYKIDVPCQEKLSCHSRQYSYNETELEDTLQSSLALLPEIPISQQPLELPFDASELDKILREPGDDSEEHLDGLEIPSIDIVASFQLLWKQPGLRVLDIRETQNDEITVDDLPFQVGMDEIKQSSSPSEYLSPASPKCNVGLSDPSKHNDHLGRLEDDIKGVEEVHLSESSEKCFSPTKFSRSLKSQANLPHDTDKGLHSPMKVDSLHVSKFGGICDSNPQTISQPSFDVKNEFNDQAPANVKCDQADLHFSALDSLTNFLDLRGKKFMKSKFDTEHAATELDWDQIEQTQGDATNMPLPAEPKSTEICEVPRTPSSSRVARSPTQLLKSKPLEEQRTIIIGESLVQSQPSLIRFLEESGRGMLNIIYRNLDGFSKMSPDIIFDAKTCFIVSHLQSLSQRPLPGPARQTEMPMIYERILRLSWEFELVLVLVHCNIVPGNKLWLRENETMAEFAGFCSKVGHTAANSKSSIVPIWISSSSQNSLTDVSKAWTWKLIHEFAYASKRLTEHVSTSVLPAFLIHDETQWEMFLRRTGLNPFAAQLVLATLPKLISDENSALQLWGLHQFVSMDNAERMARFRHLIGYDVVAKVSQFLDRST